MTPELEEYILTHIDKEDELARFSRQKHPSPTICVRAWYRVICKGGFSKCSAA